MGALFPITSTLRPVSPVLQGRALGFFNSDDAYIADKVLPTVSNVEKTGTLTSVARASGFGDITDSLLRGAKSKYHRSLGPQLSSLTWNCEEYGDEAMVDLQQIIDAEGAGGTGIDLEFIESQVALENLRVWQERRAADLLFNTTTFTQNATLVGADQFSASTSNPIGVIDTACRTVHSAIGKKPNTIAFGYLPFHTVLTNASILSYGATTKDRNMLTKDELQALLGNYFGLTNCFVGEAFYNTVNQGGTVTLSPIWGDMIWIGYMDYDLPAAQITRNKAAFKQSAAMRFLQTDLVSEEYESPEYRSKVIRHRHIMDEVVTNAASGYIINDVTA